MRDEAVRAENVVRAGCEHVLTDDAPDWAALIAVRSELSSMSGAGGALRRVAGGPEGS